MSNQYLPIGQAADFLGVSVKTLRRWEEKGRITSKRLDGKNRYFHITDIERLKFGDVLNIKDAAGRLNLSTSTLRRLSDEGKIKSELAENGYRTYKISDLEKFVTSESKTDEEVLVRDVVHKGIEEQEAVQSSTRVHLQNLHQIFGRANRFWKFTLLSFLGLMGASGLIFAGLVAAFATTPQSSAEFFNIPYRSINTKILGVSTNTTVEGKVLGITSAILQTSAETAVRVVRVFNPTVVENIILPEQQAAFIAETIPSGESGKDGEQGPQGIAGQSGQTGTTGIQGVNGDAGATGVSGPTGVSGSNGTTGAKGDAGAAGATGADGSFLGSYDSSSGLVLNAYGTGVGETTALLFYELESNGSEYVGFKAPDSVATSTTWILPATDGTNGQCISTNGSATLSFADCATTAITSFNGLTGQTQTFATGTSGSDFTIASSGTTHTFNIPDAGSSSRGLVTTSSQTFAGTKTFSSPLIAPTTGNTLNGLIINSGAVSGVTGLTFSSGGLNLASGGITNAGAVSGATGITSSGTITFSSLTTDGIVTISGGVLNSSAGGSGSTINADLLDSLNSTAFLRSNTNTTFSGGTFRIPEANHLVFGASGTPFDMNSNGSDTFLTQNSSNLYLENLGGGLISLKTNSFELKDTSNNPLMTMTSAGTLNVNNGLFQVNSAGAISSVVGITSTGNINANAGLDIDDVFVVADGGLTATVADNFWQGLGASAGRIEFDDQTTDEVNILNANVGIGTATPNSKLQVYDTVGSAFDASSTVTGGADNATGATINGSKIGGTADIVTGLSVSAGVFTSATAATAYGLYVNGENSSSTVTDGYLLYLDGSFSATNNYGIYQVNSSAKNYLGGNLGIGDTSPTAALTVGNGDLFQVNSSGAIAVTTGITSSGNINANGGLDVDDAFVIADGGVLTTSQLATFNSTLDANGTVTLGDNDDTIVLNSSVWDINASGVASGLTGLTSSGTITLSSLNTAGALLYTNSSGVVANTAQGSSGQCLISNGSSAPSWTSCASASNNYFTQVDGLTYLSSTSSDFAVGGTASSSAKFAVLGMNSGIPTASVSAGLAGGMYMTADGKLATTAKQNVTIGDSNSGNVIVNPSGNVGIGMTAPATKLDIDAGSNSTGLRLRGLAETTEIADMYVGVDGKLILSTANTGASSAYIEMDAEDNDFGFILRDSSTGSTQYANMYMNDATVDYLNIVVNTTNATTGLVIDDDNQVGIGITSPEAYLDVTGSATSGNSLRLRSGDASGDSDSNQIQFSFAGSALYTQALKTRHNSGADASNAIDFYTWDFGTDATTATGTKNVLTIDGNDTGVVAIGGDLTPDASLEVINNGSGDSFLVADTNDGDTTPFVIQSDGDVGIGTSTPDTNAKLHVSSSSDTSLLVEKTTGSFLQMAADDTSSGFIFDDDGDFRITTSNATTAGYPGGGWFVLDADGDFKLGSIITQGDARVSITDNVDPAIVGMQFYGTALTADAGMSIDAGTYMGGITINDTEAGKMYFSMGDSSSLANRETNVKMVLAQDGSLGIGTTSPTHPLDISSSGQVLETLTSSYTAGTWLQLTNTSTGGSTYSIISTGSGNGEGAGKLLFNNSGGPRLVIDTDGDIGIGQNSPGVKLHVGSTSITDGTSLLRLEDANSTCNFTANSGSPSCGSDMTLKKDVSSLDTSDLLTKVAGLRPVSYHWKTDGGEASLNYGFIAQEVEAVFPELVTEDVWADGSTKKFLNIGGLVPYIVGAVQQQQLQIDYLSDTLGLSESDKAVLGAATKASLSATPTTEQEDAIEPATVIADESELMKYSGLTKPEIVNYKLWKMTGNIVFTGQISFADVTKFLSTVIFTSDTVGTITIPENTTKVSVTFTKPFNKTPIVNLTPVKSIRGEYSLEEVTTEGFILVLTEGQEAEVLFNWTAFISEGTKPKVKVLETPVPTQVGATPSPKQEEKVSPTIESTKVSSESAHTE